MSVNPVALESLSYFADMILPVVIVCIVAIIIGLIGLLLPLLFRRRKKRGC